jgi:transposase
MDVREQRGREIAQRARIEKSGNCWIVPSQSDKGSYRVTLESDSVHCTCPDFELRAKPCKHIFAAAFVVQRQTVTETVTPSGQIETTTVTETAAVRVTYAQNWPQYNKAQSQEKELFCRLLHDLCRAVPEPIQERGRPRIPLPDALFSACFKVYSGMSGRRFMTDLREAQSAGYVQRAYHFNPVLRVIADEELTPTLYQLVTASAAPLAAVEETFAVDSTGFGTVRYYRHFTAKYGGREIEARDWLKLHALVGTKTNVIAAAEITDRNANDSPQFVPLLTTGKDTFAIKAVVADKAYGSRTNVRRAAEMGATPYIALKSNTVGYATDKMTRGADDSAWRSLWHLYNYRRDDFLATYHARSNAESTFSAMKRVFGDMVRAKGRTAQVNELLLKVIAYNIICVVHWIFELGVSVPGFESA